MNTAGPFPENVLSRQIQGFLESLVVRENAFSLCDFPELAVITFDHVGCVDNLADLRRIFEESGEFSPVAFPRL